MEPLITFIFAGIMNSQPDWNLVIWKFFQKCSLAVLKWTIL